MHAARGLPAGAHAARPHPPSPRQSKHKCPMCPEQFSSVEGVYCHLDSHSSGRSPGISPDPVLGNVAPSVWRARDSGAIRGPRLPGLHLEPAGAQKKMRDDGRGWSQGGVQLPLLLKAGLQHPTLAVLEIHLKTIPRDSHSRARVRSAWTPCPPSTTSEHVRRLHKNHAYP